MPAETEISRFPVSIEAPTTGMRGSPAVVEFERSLVRLRSGARVLDRSPVSAAKVKRIDSETFRLSLGSSWVIRPENLVEFLFEAAPSIDAAVRPSRNARRRRIPPIVLHLALTSAIFLVGLVMGRFQFDGSERLTWLIAGIMLLVGILWSRLWNLDGSVEPTTQRADLHLESTATVDLRRRVSGNVDLIRELLGERLGAPEPEAIATWLPPITISAGEKRSIHLLPASEYPSRGQEGPDGPFHGRDPLGNLKPE